MIVEEKINYENEEYIKHYSDAHKYIRQIETGLLFEEAEDRADSNYSYVESEIDLDDSEQALNHNLDILQNK